LGVFLFHFFVVPAVFMIRPKRKIRVTLQCDGHDKMLLFERYSQRKINITFGTPKDGGFFKDDFPLSVRLMFWGSSRSFCRESAFSHFAQPLFHQEGGAEQHVLALRRRELGKVKKSTSTKSLRGKSI